MGNKNGRKEEGLNKGNTSMEAKPKIKIIIEGLKKTMCKKGNYHERRNQGQKTQKMTNKK